MLGSVSNLGLRVNVIRKECWEQQDPHVAVLSIRAEMCFVTCEFYVVPPSALGGERFNYLTWKE